MVSWHNWRLIYDYDIMQVWVFSGKSYQNTMDTVWSCNNEIQIINETKYVITNIMYELLILSNCMLSIANTITAIKTMNLSFITMSAFFNRNILMRLTTDISSQMSHKNHQIQWYIFVTSIVCYVSSCCILSMNEARQSKNF